MTGTPRLLFHVQHLLGIGHLRRAALISRALAGSGFAVTVAQGGMPSDLFDFGAADIVQLPPLRSIDDRFGGLVQADGAPLDDAGRAVRCEALLALFARVKPDVVLLESFPFGRRQLRFELVPLLERIEAIRPRPAVAVSVRDILQARKPERVAETCALVLRHVDRVLVHGDTALVPLDASFPRTAEIAHLVRYTGYVAPEPPARAERRRVVVSAGGGAVGADLLRAALAARPLTGLADAPWTLIAGPHLPPEALAALGEAAGGGVTLLPSVADLPGELAGAIVSVSQAGYNTLMDVAVSETPAVVVPFAGAGETEQPMRAARLAERGHVEVVDEAAPTPVTLAAAIDRAAGRTGRWPRIALDGAAETARLLRALHDERTAADG